MQGVEESLGFGERRFEGEVMNMEEGFLSLGSAVHPCDEFAVP